MVTLALLGSLAAAALVFGPAQLRAGEGGGSASQVDPQRQAVLDQVAALIRRSHAVLAVHPRGPGPFSEVLLWLDDGATPGVVDLDELALLSHSRVLRTLSLVMLAAPVEVAAADLDQLFPDIGAASGEVRIGFSDLRRRAFCDRWRSFDHVGVRILARGLNDADFTITGPRQVQVALTWTGRSVDDLQRAAALVEVAAPMPAGLPKTDEHPEAGSAPP